MKRFIECLVPVTACNLRCSYCYVARLNRNTNEIGWGRYSAEHIGKALCVDRLGGVSFISMTGAGETLLPKEIPALVFNILKQGHFVNITTNGTLTARIEEIVVFPREYLERLHFAFSLHYVELCRVSKLEEFFKNVARVREAGCSFVVQVNLSDEYMPIWAEILQVVKARTGALPQVALTRDETTSGLRIFTQRTDDEYIAVAREAISPLFEFTLNNFRRKRREFCYAGDWSGTLDLKTGILSSCYCSGRQQDILCKIEQPIQFEAIGHNCLHPYCYNSSHFLSLGLIPSLRTPSYGALRNREEAGWYTAAMRAFLNERLYAHNSQYSLSRRLYVDCKYRCVHNLRHMHVRLMVLVKVLLMRVVRPWKSLRMVLRDAKRGMLALRATRVLGKVATSRRIIFIGSPLHINLGDHAIAMISLDLFKQRLSGYEVVEVPGEVFVRFSDEIRVLVRTNDRIVVIGGGFLGSLWINEEEMVRSVIRAFPDNRIVILPQTVLFDRSAAGMVELTITRDLYQSHRDLHLFVRDRSIDFVRKELCGGSFSDVRQAPDMVLFADCSFPSVDRSGVILCFRADKERLHAGSLRNEIEAFLTSLCNENCSVVDTVLKYDVSLRKREYEVNRKLDEFRSARLVITDRLHGMIFSAVTGTPCIALDNSSNKVGGVWSLWLQHLPYIRFAASASDVLSLIPEMLSMGGNQYDPKVFESYWQEIADVIR